MGKDYQDNNVDIQKALGVLETAGPKKRFKMIFLLVAALIVCIGGWFLLKPNGQAALKYITAPVERGNLVVTVTATGELEPVNQVDVGTEVSGTIKTVAVDFNDHVKTGQILAKLDTTKLEAQVLQSKSNLASANAKLLQTEASLLEAVNELSRLEHVRKLSNGKVPSQHDLDAAEAAVKKAKAEKASAEASIAQAQASLDANQSDLDKAVIRAPIDGIVLDRAVEPGQTVAASLQTPVLFTLAEDLTKMELHVDVDEADVGQVKEGQAASFSVDAYPARTFPATITQVRFAPQSENGVVTYKTLLLVENQDLLLRPGMTATADIRVETITDGLLIPNAALRFTPETQMQEAPKEGGGLIRSLLPRRPPRRTVPKNSEPGKTLHKKVWILEKDLPKPIPVTVGVTDGKMTQIIDGDLQPSQAIILNIVEAS